MGKRKHSKLTGLPAWRRGITAVTTTTVGEPGGSWFETQSQHRKQAGSRVCAAGFTRWLRHTPFASFVWLVCVALPMWPHPASVSFALEHPALESQKLAHSLKHSNWSGPLGKLELLMVACPAPVAVPHLGGAPIVWAWGRQGTGAATWKGPARPRCVLTHLSPRAGSCSQN